MFDYFISLGPACGVASSMSKFGLRSFSGVFDWLITRDLKWVLYHIETDFKYFLLQDNLKRYDDNIYHFYDIQSGFKFIHEDENFEIEYNDLKNKYNRRIKNFLARTKSKVCYLRIVKEKKELEYIKKNTDHIKSIIKKNNPNSEIVFLLENESSMCNNFGFHCFTLGKCARGGGDLI